MKFSALALLLIGCGSSFEATTPVDAPDAAPGDTSVSTLDAAVPSEVPDAAPSTTVVPPAPIADAGAPVADSGFDASVDNPIDSAAPIVCEDAGAAFWLCSWAGVSVPMSAGSFCLYEDLPTNKVPAEGRIPAACSCTPTCDCVAAHYTCPVVTGMTSLGVESNSCTTDGHGHVVLSCRYMKN